MPTLRNIFRKYIYAALLLVSSLCASAQMSATTEYQVKAVFLFNFAQFVEWSPQSFASANSPLVISVLGENPFGSYLENVVAGEKVNGHPLVVHYYKNAEDIKNCHILFINKAQENSMSTILTSVRGKNILTVSDASGFLYDGGMIRFFTRNNKINLQINIDSARADNLVISSKLLRLAEIFVP